jgi:hypothetical protein
MRGQGPQDIGFMIGAALGLAYYLAWGQRGSISGFFIAMICSGIGWLIAPSVARLTTHLTGG